METTDKKNWLLDNFSPRTFMIGMGIICLFYIALSIWIVLNAEALRMEQEKVLTSRTVIIERMAPLPKAEKKQAPAQPAAQGDESLDKVAEKYIQPVSNETTDKLEKLPGGMIKSPVEGLHERTKDGVIPVIRERDRLTAFQAYRRPFNRSLVDAPLISIAIMNLGLSDTATESAIRNMPKEISLILSPYAKAAEFWASEARTRGHEVWLSLPTETESYPLYDPGPHTLLVKATERDNLKKLEWLMGRMTGYVGFVTEYKPTFMKAIQDMRPVVNTIYNHGLAFVDGSDEPGVIPQSLAHGINAPYATIDVWIDAKQNRGDIQKNLAELEKIARERGMAAGVINAYPLSYQEVQEWLKELEKKGFALAPLSAQTGL